MVRKTKDEMTEELLATLEGIMCYIDQVSGCPNPHEDMAQKGEKCAICEMFYKAKVTIAEAKIMGYGKESNG